MATLITPARGSFGWTDTKQGNLTHLDTFSQNDPFLFIEQIQALSEKVRLWGYQLIYDDSSTCHWCIADVAGNILWRSYGLSKAIWRLERQIQNS